MHAACNRIFYWCGFDPKKIATEASEQKKTHNKQSSFATVRITRTKALNNNSKIECIISSSVGSSNRSTAKKHVKHGHSKFLQQSIITFLFCSLGRVKSLNWHKPI